MTCHIAISNSTTAVLLSDSQGSSDTSESHGLQKQFAGPDFLVGVTGLGSVMQALFSRLEQATQQGAQPLRAAGLQAFLEGFVETELRPGVRGDVEFIAVIPPNVKQAGVQTFELGKFVHMGPRRHLGYIGSGADFVSSALSSYEKFGIDLPQGSLADLVILVEDLAKAANECLTVDDAFLLGVLTHGRAYLLGDRRIGLSYAPDLLKKNWTEAARRFRAIMAAARAVNREFVAVQRQLSAIRIGTLTQANLESIRASNDGVITTSRRSLIQQLSDYFVWYDTLLGRQVHPLMGISGAVSNR